MKKINSPQIRKRSNRPNIPQSKIAKLPQNPKKLSFPEDSSEPSPQIINNDKKCYNSKTLAALSSRSTKNFYPSNKLENKNILSNQKNLKKKLKFTILDSLPLKISKIKDTENLNALLEDFFITSIPKNECFSCEEISELHNKEKLGQCGHEICQKLLSYKPGLIFRFPKNDKNPKNFIISELVTSLCFPYGIKICFGNYGSKENLFPKKENNFYFVTTNELNEQNYIYVYNFYIKMSLIDFKRNYKCDPIKDFINILYKNNDKELQSLFEKCQELINTPFVYIPHALCLVSKYPYFNEMKKCIYSILKIKDSEVELIKFLKNIIYEIPSINKYTFHDLQLISFPPYQNNPLVFKSKNFNRGTLIDLSYIKILFVYFSVSTLIKIFKLMLTSQKLLFVVNDSSEYYALTSVTLALLNLLYPFNWKYTYIPLLSINMLKFLQSFLPFIMGIDSRMLDYAKNNFIENQNNISIIYLKRNRKSVLEEGHEDENSNIEIPSFLKNSLVNDLEIIKKLFSKNIDNNKEINEEIGKQIRQIFIKFFVKIFGDYQEYTTSIDETAYFNSESFMKNISKEHQKFYETIFNSEMFYDFLQRNVVISSNLYKPDRYFNKYCLRERRGRNISKIHNNKKGSFLSNISNFINKDQNAMESILKAKIKKTKKRQNSVDVQDKNKNINNSCFIPNNSNMNNIIFNKDSSHNTSDNENVNKEEENEESSSSSDSSFNSEITTNKSYKNTKFLIPPYFINKKLLSTNIKEISDEIADLCGKENIITMFEFEKIFIFDSLPIINYDKMKNDFNQEIDKINKYNLPNEILEEYKQTLIKKRRSTISNLSENDQMDPRIIQLDDFMKEILSSSGKNASAILEHSKKEQNENQISENNIEEKNDNLGRNSKNSRGNLDFLSVIDFKNIKLRVHFASIIFQNKINEYQCNIISSHSFNILSKMIFNIFLYSGNKSIEDFQVCRAVTKSLYSYCKKNHKGKKIFLYQAFNKGKPFDIWNDRNFWQYYFDRELEYQNGINDNTKFNVLIEMASIMNDLHFQVNMVVDILVDIIAKKELTDKELQKSLSFTIVKQYNNRVVEHAAIEAHKKDYEYPKNC